jgi:hypothetical protein
LTAVDAKAVATVEIPADLAGRGDLLVIGYPELPEVRIDGEVVAPLRSSKSALNNFASYAVAGMKSTKVREWRMASFDLSAKTGKKVRVELAGGERELRAEAWLLAERKAVDEAFEMPDLPWAISAGSRRETVCLVPERPLRPTPVPTRALTADDLRGLRKAWLTIEHFGVSAGHGTKRLFLNGKELAVLPDGPDEWRKARIEVPVGSGGEHARAAARFQGRQVQVPRRGVAGRAGGRQRRAFDIPDDGADQLRRLGSPGRRAVPGEGRGQAGGA